jgi:hypothetical protein
MSWNNLVPSNFRIYQNAVSTRNPLLRYSFSVCFLIKSVVKLQREENECEHCQGCDVRQGDQYNVTHLASLDKHCNWYCSINTPHPNAGELHGQRIDITSVNEDHSCPQQLPSSMERNFSWRVFGWIPNRETLRLLWNPRGLVTFFIRVCLLVSSWTKWFSFTFLLCNILWINNNLCVKLVINK